MATFNEHPGLAQGLNVSEQLGQVPRQYGEWLVYNSDAAALKPGYLVEVVGTCKGDGTAGAAYFKVAKPSANNVTAVLVIPFGIQPGKVGVGTMDDRYAGLPVLYSGSTPAIGSTLGTASGSFLAAPGGTGFVVMSVDAANSRAFCRAASAGGGGGSASLQIVQAVANGSAGVVSTKVMTLKADVSASPNFTLATTAANANYFKL